MLEQLKFVQGSVAKKDLVPALTHFRIENGRVKGFNGKLALCTPIDFDIDCTPKAEQLVKAIGQCTEAVQLGMTKTGRLSVKSGKFRAYVECVDGPTPHVEPEGRDVEIDGEVMLDAMAKLQPLIADDAARPWSNGILFTGNSAFATNNVIVAQYWLGTPFPETVVVPRDAIKEMLRIKKPPTRFQMCDKTLTAHYEDGSWLRANLLEAQWPNVEPLFDVPLTGLVDIPELFFEGLAAMKPFTDKFGRIVFEPGLMRTHELANEQGSSFELDWLTNQSTFVLPMLQKLEGIAERIDLGIYPDPCPWTGGNMRGVIVGLRWLEGIV